MVLTEYLRSLFTPAAPESPAATNESANSAPVPPADPQSARPFGISEYFSAEPSLTGLEPPRSFVGLNLFSSEAIPLANLTVGTSSMSFGDVNVGSSSPSQSFYLKNDSDAPVDFAINGTPSGFSISPTSGRIPARSSVNIYVTFSPTREGSYSDYINPSPASGSVSVTGNGKKN